ncbi:MAG: hypothetical protein ACLUD9_04670 [Anaerotignum faecicola]
MQYEKRNRVLEAILCAALAVVVSGGYMFAAKDNGVFALEDIEGDRTALNAFAFEGLAGMITDRFTISGRMAS